MKRKVETSLNGQFKAIIGEELRYLNKVWEENEVAWDISTTGEKFPEYKGDGQVVHGGAGGGVQGQFS